MFQKHTAEGVFEMERLAEVAAKLRPGLERLERKADRLLDRAATDAFSGTEKAIARMLAAVERKRSIAAIAALYDDLTSLMTAGERAVYDGRAAGRTDDEMAAELNVSRSTVRNYYARAAEKCGWMLTAMRKSGRDMSALEVFCKLPRVSARRPSFSTRAERRAGTRARRAPL